MEHRIRLSAADRKELVRLSRRYSAPFGLVIRARIALLAVQKVRTMEIARRLGVPRQQVLKWRERAASEGLRGLLDRPRPGRPRRQTAA
jgi:transposase